MEGVWLWFIMVFFSIYLPLLYERLRLSILLSMGQGCGIAIPPPCILIYVMRVARLPEAG